MVHSMSYWRLKLPKIMHKFKATWILVAYTTCIWSWLLNDYNALLLDESIAKSMDYNPKSLQGHKPLLSENKFPPHNPLGLISRVILETCSTFSAKFI